MRFVKVFVVFLLIFFISCGDSVSKTDEDHESTADSDSVAEGNTDDDVSDDGGTQKEDASGGNRDHENENDSSSDEISDDNSDENTDDSDIVNDAAADEEADENTDSDSEKQDETVDNESPDEDSSSGLFTGIRIIEKGGFFQPRSLYSDRSTKFAVIEDKAVQETRIFDISGTPVCDIDEGARGVAFDDEGNIYITVFGNEVKKYSSTCAYISKAGGSGTGDGQFAGMYGIAFYNSKLYIVDKSNDRVQVFKKDLTFDSILALGTLSEPIMIDINSSGQILVVEDHLSSKTINVFGSDLTKDWSVSGITYFSHAAIRSDGAVVVTFAGRNCIKVYKDGSAVDTEGTCGAFDGVLENEFDIVSGVTAFNDGSVLVSDENNSRIKKFNKQSSGDGLVYAETLYGSDYLFTRSESLWIDSNDHLYFTDFGMIRVLDDVGNEVRKISSLGIGENQLNDPKMMTIDETSVYVADVNNNYLYSFKKDGAFQSKVLFYENSVFGMADDSSYVYVATSNGLLRYSKSDLNTNETITLQGLSGSIKKITSGKSGVIFVHDGSNICRFADADSAPNCISASVGPNVMVEDNDGNLLAVYNYSVVKYDSDLNQIGMLSGSEMGEYGFIEYVKGVAVDSKGYVYISESTTARSRIIVIDLHF